VPLGTATAYFLPRYAANAASKASVAGPSRSSGPQYSIDRFKLGRRNIRIRERNKRIVCFLGYHIVEIADSCTHPGPIMEPHSVVQEQLPLHAQDPSLYGAMIGAIKRWISNCS